MDRLVGELARALGMTPAEIEALGLSAAEMRRLLAGFTEDTVVVGSRAQPRSATESAVPVDVLSAADLVSQGAGPDHTLVLINSKRRHRSSIVDYHGGNGVAFGS